MTLTGVQIPTLAPGSPEWLTRMSASKVAAMLGLSTYDSPYSLWHVMAGLVEPEPDNDVKRRGHYLEPAVAAWFTDQHPEYALLPGGTWQHKARPWQIASPDRLLTPYVVEAEILNEDGTLDRGEPAEPTALLELKSASDDSEWGRPGTDEIPNGYRAQVVWQMDTIGVHRCHVAVITAYLEFREYVIDYDPDEAEFIRSEAVRFMDSLPTGGNPQRPNIDEHSATYEAVRRMHPGIDRARDVELDHDTARDYCQARLALTAAQDEERRTKSVIANLLGDARRALYNGQTIAYRKPNGDNAPSLCASRNLPDFTDPERAAS
jgi:putative phage-type endonuclease